VTKGRVYCEPWYSGASCQVGPRFGTRVCMNQAYPPQRVLVQDCRGYSQPATNSYLSALEARRMHMLLAAWCLEPNTDSLLSCPHSSSCCFPALPALALLLTGAASGGPGGDRPAGRLAGCTPGCTGVHSQQSPDSSTSSRGSAEGAGVGAAQEQPHKQHPAWQTG
jgi:hypothetical protein